MLMCNEVKPSRAQILRCNLLKSGLTSPVGKGSSSNPAVYVLFAGFAATRGKFNGSQ